MNGTLIEDLSNVIAEADEEVTDIVIPEGDEDVVLPDEEADDVTATPKKRSAEEDEDDEDKELEDPEELEDFEEEEELY